MSLRDPAGSGSWQSHQGIASATPRNDVCVMEDKDENFD